MPDLDPAAVVRVLNKHGVRFVVIGGIAAQLHDLPVPATVDIDVTPARDSKNLERLAKAFDELEAGLYTADESGTGRRGRERRTHRPVRHSDSVRTSGIGGGNSCR